jgi:hypothetical protein
LIYFIAEGENKQGQLAINCIAPQNRDAFTQVVPVIDKVEMSAEGNGLVTFQSVAGAVGYRLQIAKDAGFTNLVFQDYPSSSPYGFPLTQDGTYYVRIEALKNTGLRPGYVSQWSTAKTVNRNYDALRISPNPNLTGFDLTNFPAGTGGPLMITSVGPGSGGATDAATATERGVLVTYNTGTPGWAGGGFSYDNFNTTAIESGDLRTLTNMVFGIRGDATSVKLEVVDASGQKAAVYLRNIKKDTEQFWSIPMALLTGIDLQHVRLIYFIVEGAGQQGELRINRIPLQP